MLCGGFAGKGAGAGFFGGVERETSDGDFEVGFELFFDFLGAAPVALSEAAVNLRFGGVLGGEEGVEVVSAVDGDGVRLSEFEGTGEEVVLYVLEYVGRFFNTFVVGHVGTVAWVVVAAA